MTKMDQFIKIPHPTNRVWPGTPYHVLMTVEQAYEDGRQTGLNWAAADQYVPGGPSVGPGQHIGFSALEDQERRVHREWMRGWHAGFRQQYPKAALRPQWYRRFDFDLSDV